MLNKKYTLKEVIDKPNNLTLIESNWLEDKAYDEINFYKSDDDRYFKEYIIFGDNYYKMLFEIENFKEV